MLFDGLKAGDYLKIPSGVTTINEKVTLPINVFLEGSTDSILRTSAPEFLEVQTGSRIKGISFEHITRGRTINIKGPQTNWKIENCKVKGASIFVIAEDLTRNYPIAGYGQIINCIGDDSKLSTLEGQRNVNMYKNHFFNCNVQEFVDFNYNVHYCTLDRNEFINDVGFSIDQEAIDLIGGNGMEQNYNTIQNNTIIGNFQTGIRPAKTASYNIIRNNYIKWIDGRIAHTANIYMYGTAGAKPHGNQITGNTLIGGRSGIEISCADNNNIYGNTISNSLKSISLLKNTQYGDDIAPKNNIVSRNIITVDDPANAIINEGLNDIRNDNTINGVGPGPAPNNSMVGILGAGLIGLYLLSKKR